MEDIYLSQAYLSLNPTWHDEDAPWKAQQVLRLLRQHKLPVRMIAEAGCGVGGILAHLRDALPNTVKLDGFDISPDAIERAKQRECDRLHFHNQDLFTNTEHYDLLLVMDVVEHVPDYLSFLEKCRLKAQFKIYHIPLDLHVSSVLRASFLEARRSVGHLHYFSAESALASLVDTGHKVVDCVYTDGAIALASFHPGLRRRIANFPRRLTAQFSTRWAARLFGGYSLLVLAE
jgi:SAM-dependent methyltransferase